MVTKTDNSSLKSEKAAVLDLLQYCISDDDIRATISGETCFHAVEIIKRMEEGA